MEILTLECARHEIDFVSADLFEAGTLGIAEQELADGRWQLQAYFVQAGDAAVVLPDEMHSVVNPSQGTLRIICLVPLIDGKMPTAPGTK